MFDIQKSTKTKRQLLRHIQDATKINPRLPEVKTAQTKTTHQAQKKVTSLIP